MPRPLDEILGLKKTKAVHDFQLGERVMPNHRQGMFRAGRYGSVESFDKWNRVVVVLDDWPHLKFPFHHSELNRIEGA